MACLQVGSGASWTGVGVPLGAVTYQTLSAADVEAFMVAFGVPNCPPSDTDPVCMEIEKKGNKIKKR